MKVFTDHFDILDKMMYLRPFCLFVSKGKTPPDMNLKIPGQRPFCYYDRHEKSWHCFSKINSDLLIAIGENDVSKVGRCLKQNRINVNQRYVIPVTETPNMEVPHLGTFLHRAVFYCAQDVFSFLLKNGANPRLKDQNGKTVLKGIAESTHLADAQKIKLTKILIDYGTKKSEIRQAFERQDSLKEVLYSYYNTKNVRCVAKHKVNVSGCSPIRTRV